MTLRKVLAVLALGLAAVAPARAGCRLNQFGTLPVTMRGVAATTPAKINGADVVFQVDSGAALSVISPASAAQYHIPVYPTLFGAYMSGIGGSANIGVAIVRDFGISNANLHDVRFIEGGSDVTAPAVGVIGQNILGVADVEYDLAGGMVRLMAPHGCASEPLAYWAHGDPYSVLPLERLRGGTLFTRASVLVNGVPMRALFDTGASTSLITPAAALRAGVKLDGPGVQREGEMRGFGARLVPLSVAPFDVVQIGDEQIHHTHLYVGELGDSSEDMLIGADFFLSHHVYVANSQHRMYFTYAGGKVFDLSRPLKLTTAPGAAAPAQPSAGPPAAPPAETAAAGAEPADAEGFSRRGEARAARRDFAGAMADLDRAVKMDPGEARYLAERADLHLRLEETGPAAADLDAALTLKPGDAEAHAVRASLRLADHDAKGAREDVNAASTAAAREADLRLTLAGLDLDLDAFGPAAAEATLWMAAHRDDSRMAQALNMRCWAHALGAEALDGALGDCNRAVRLSGRSPGMLDSRGLLHLRRAEYALAIADYDAALTAEPRLAWSLYGRGLAELRTGDKAKGQADLAAASAIDPGLTGRAARLGLSPST